MIIGFEAQRIFRNNKHGMDFVALELIRALQKLDVSNQYVVFTNDGPDKDCLLESENVKIVTFGGSFPVWEQILLPKYAKQHNCDILHCTSNTAPVYSKVPVVVTLHDIIYLENNPLIARGYNSYQRFGNYYRRIVVKAILTKARKIITVSNFEKERLVEFLGLSSEKVSVIYNGVGVHFFEKHSKGEILKVVSRYSLPANYFLFLGNTDPKKNSKNTILAFVKFIDRVKSDVQLVVADYNKELVREILRSAGLEKYFSRIHFTGYIDNKDLPLVIQGAQIFLYPSKRESFGIPILEAMAGGIPVITSDAASMPEVSGGYSYLVDPLNLESIIKGMVDLSTDEKLWNRLSAGGRERAASFRWKDSASQMLEIYKTVN